MFEIRVTDFRSIFSQRIEVHPTIPQHVLSQDLGKSRIYTRLGVKIRFTVLQLAPQQCSRSAYRLSERLKNSNRFWDFTKFWRLRESLRQDVLWDSEMVSRNILESYHSSGASGLHFVPFHFPQRDRIQLSLEFHLSAVEKNHIKFDVLQQRWFAFYSTVYAHFHDKHVVRSKPSIAFGLNINMATCIDVLSLIWTPRCHKKESLTQKKQQCQA